MLEQETENLTLNVNETHPDNMIMIPEPLLRKLIHLSKLALASLFVLFTIMLFHVLIDFFYHSR